MLPVSERDTRPLNVAQPPQFTFGYFLTVGLGWGWSGFSILHVRDLGGKLELDQMRSGNGDVPRLFGLSTIDHHRTRQTFG